MSSKIRFSQEGFTLVETLVTLALLSGLVLIGAKVLEMIDANSKNSNRKEAQMSFYLRGVNVIDANLRGLKRHQFNPHLLYRIKPDTGIFEQNSVGPSDLTITKPVEPAPLSSFVFQKKIGAIFLSYTAVCIPITKAWNNDGITYDSISINTLWPFVRKVDNAIKVYCCTREEPNCTTNPVLTQNSNYTVQIYRYNPAEQKLTPLLKKNEFKAISGLGYFIFSHSTNETSLYSRFFVFYNECISQKIMAGASKPNCNAAIWFKTAELLKDFDYTSEGVNNLGGEIGL